MATKKVTTATTKDVTAKVTAPETKTSEKAETCLLYTSCP